MQRNALAHAFARLTGRRKPRAPRNAALLLLGLSFALLALGQQGPEIEVQAQRNGDLIDVRAQAVVRAPLAVVWATLTDYERLPDFIPGLESSRILARQGERITVAQTGQIRFLFLTLPIAITVESIERPPYVLEVRRISGSVRHLQGQYEATPLANQRVHLRWTGRVSPEADLPPLIGTTLARLSIQEQFEGMVREIESRAGIRRVDTPAPAFRNR